MLKRSALAPIIASLPFGGAAQADLDPDLPEYSRVSGIAGSLSSVGSDTLNNLMTLWAETFQGFYPDVNIQIQGAGGSAIQARPRTGLLIPHDTGYDERW